MKPYTEAKIKSAANTYENSAEMYKEEVVRDIHYLKELVESLEDEDLWHNTTALMNAASCIASILRYTGLWYTYRNQALTTRSIIRHLEEDEKGEQ